MIRRNHYAGNQFGKIHGERYLFPKSKKNEQEELPDFIENEDRISAVNTFRELISDAIVPALSSEKKDEVLLRSWQYMTAAKSGRSCKPAETGIAETGYPPCRTEKEMTCR